MFIEYAPLGLVCMCVQRSWASWMWLVIDLMVSGTPICIFRI